MTVETGIPDPSDVIDIVGANGIGTILDVGAAGGPLAGIGSALTALTDPGMWRRIGVAFLGGLLIWAGIVMVLSQTRAFRDAVGVISGTAVKAVTKGAV